MLISLKDLRIGLECVYDQDDRRVRGMGLFSLLSRDDLFNNNRTGRLFTPAALIYVPVERIIGGRAGHMMCGQQPPPRPASHFSPAVTCGIIRSHAAALCDRKWPRHGIIGHHGDWRASAAGAILLSHYTRSR